MLAVLIAVNAVVYVAMIAAQAAGADLSSWLALSSSCATLVERPWTVVSYAFVQTNILQLVFNMLWLFAFGRLFAMQASERALVFTYMGGALGGAVVYLAASSVFDLASPWMLSGASAAVIAVAVAVAVMMPDSEINLPLFGPTRVKWIVGVAVVLFFINLSTPNAGGNLAHIGGVAAGLASAKAIKRPHRATSQKSNAEYSRLTSKIQLSGFESLTASERRRFFELSSQRK